MAISFRLSLLFTALWASAVGAQPSVQTFWTLEAKIAEADAVVRGPIARITKKEIVKPGARDEKGIMQPDGIYDRILAVRVDEVLKGKIKGPLNDLRPIEAFVYSERYDEYQKAGTQLLWFLGPNPERGEKRGWSILRLGKPVPGEHSREPPIFGADFKLLRSEAEILDRAQHYASISTKRLPVHVIRVAPLIARTLGPWNEFVLPVDAALERRAKQLIESPNDFAPAGEKLDETGHQQMRYGGVSALRYFKSKANVAVLRSLLDEPDEDFKTAWAGQYPLRKKAYEILLTWDVDMPRPKSAERATSLDLSDSPMTDAGMKRLTGLGELAYLDLQGTHVTHRGLPALAGLTQLHTIKLREEQVTDAVLRVLRKAELSHALAYGKGDERPMSAADVTWLFLDRTATTDEGLKELVGLTNLRSLTVSDTQVTGIGFKHLSGLKNLGSIYLARCPVGDTGIKEIGHLTNLTWLGLSYTSVTDAGLKGLAPLTNLQILDLEGTKVTATGLKQLAGMKSLIVVRLDGAQVNDESLRSLREIGMLRVLSTDTTLQNEHPKTDAALTSFGLWGPYVTDDGLKELAGLTNLQSLSLGSMKITGSGFKHLAGLTKLTDLSVHGTALTEEGLREIVALKNLRTLHMYGKDITDERLRALCQVRMVHVLYEAGSSTDYPPGTAPPRAKSDDAVRSLDIGGWRSTEGSVVTDAVLKELAGLKNLAKLDLTHTYVTGSGLKDLAGLQKLTTLHVGSFQVTDDSMKDLPQLKHLTELGLHDTKMTSAGVKHVAKLKNLRSLKLTGKSVNDDWLLEIASQEKLTYLRLLWTSVTDAGIAEFQRAHPGCKVER